jgi:phage terminase small subunit
LSLPEARRIDVSKEATQSFLPATQAAIRAEYKLKRAYSISNENLKKTEIQEAIQQAQKERSTRNEITGD